MNLGEVGDVGSREATGCGGLPRGTSREIEQEKALAWGWKASLNLRLFGDKLATMAVSDSHCGQMLSVSYPHQP